jgi:hypothetical protein
MLIGTMSAEMPIGNHLPRYAPLEKTKLEEIEASKKKRLTNCLRNAATMSSVREQKVK